MRWIGLIALLLSAQAAFGQGWHMPKVLRVSEVTPSFLLSVTRGEFENYSVVRKFGRNPDLDAGVAEDLWAQGGDYTFPTAAQIVDIVSTTDDDSLGGSGAHTVAIEGLDANYAVIRDTVDLEGLTQVSTTNAYLRIFRMRVTAGGSAAGAAGNITADQTTSGTVVGYIAAGVNQTQLAVYTVPVGFTAYILGLQFNATKGTTSAVDIDMRVREFGSVFHTRGTYGANTRSGEAVLSFPCPVALPARTDIVFRGTATGNNTQVALEFPMLLVADE